MPGSLYTSRIHAATTPRPVALQNEAEVFHFLFRSAADTPLQAARGPKYLGAEIGFFTVLHTWN